MPPPERTKPDPDGSGPDEYATQRTDRDSTPHLSQPVLQRCVGPTPCLEVAARWTASVDAWLDDCDEQAAGLARQAANYARLHELEPLPDGEVAR